MAVPHPGKKFAGGEEPGHGQNKANEEDNSDVIGLPNVDEDLFGVNEVIDSHGVKARFEFFKKEEFDEQQKDFDKAENESGAEEENAMPPSGEPRVWNEQKPRKQWKGLEKRHEKVAMKAAQKGVDDISSG